MAIYYYYYYIIFTLRRTSFFLGLVRPRANARFLVVHQSTGTRDRVKFTVHAVIKLVANFLILVRKITILSGTIFGRLWRLWRKKYINSINASHTFLHICVNENKQFSPTGVSFDVKFATVSQFTVKLYKFLRVDSRNTNHFGLRFGRRSFCRT